MHKANAHGMATLVYSGWLFKIEKSGKQQRYGRGLSWAYWHLFDFNNVEMQALGSAATNIVLVVVIGVLNLPVYVPALGSSLRVPYNMDHEFIGQGAANLLAGFAGTVPNILVRLITSCPLNLLTLHFCSSNYLTPCSSHAQEEAAPRQLLLLV